MNNQQAAKLTPGEELEQRIKANKLEWQRKLFHEKWNRRIATIFVIAGIILLFLLVDKFYFVPQRKRNANINPAIYTALRQIESYCGEYIYREVVNQDELKRCKEIYAQKQYCNDWTQGNNIPSQCAINSYYKYFQQRGFNLPSFYKAE